MVSNHCTVYGGAVTVLDAAFAARSALTRGLRLHASRTEHL